MIEVWKDVIGFEGKYQVSSNGKIKSLPREVPRGDSYYTVVEREMSQGIGGVGYPTVGLSRDGKTKTYNVHSLVASAFLIQPEGTNCVNHKDGDKCNNAVDNLEWVTTSENRKHAYAAGLVSPPHTNKYGVKNPNAKGGKLKMPNGDLLVFKSQADLCRQFSLSASGVSNLLSGKLKSHKGWTNEEMWERYFD